MNRREFNTDILRFLALSSLMSFSTEKSLAWAASRRRKAKKPLTSLSHVAFTFSQGSNSISVPSSSTTGDIVLYFERWYNNGTTSPAGFTQIFDNVIDSSLDSLAAYYAIDDGSLANTSLPVAAGSTYNNQWCIILRPVGQLTSITVHDYEDHFATSDPPPITINATSGNAPMLVVGYQRNSSTGLGFTVESPNFQYEENLGLTSGGTVGYTLYNPGDTLADHTIDWGNTGSTKRLAGFYLSFT